MRTVKMYHPKGNPLWNSGEFKIEVDGEIINTSIHMKYPKDGSFKIWENEKGIIFQEHNCSSGGGKVPLGEQILLIPKDQYNEIEYIGNPLVFPKDFY